MFPKSFFTCPSFSSYHVAWAKPSAFGVDRLWSFLGPCHVFYLGHQKEGVSGKKCVLSREQWRGGGQETGEIPRGAWLSYRPLSNLPGYGIAIKTITWKSTTGHISITFPAGLYFSQHQLPPAFQWNTSALLPKMLPLESLVKIIIPGLCFCPSFRCLTERHPNYKFPFLFLILIQVY